MRMPTAWLTPLLNYRTVVQPLHSSMDEPPCEGDLSSLQKTTIALLKSAGAVQLGCHSFPCKQADLTWQAQQKILRILYGVAVAYTICSAT